MRHTVERLDGETESIGLVSDGKLERGVDVTLFHVSANVDVSGSGPSVGESVNQPRVRVEGDDNGLVSGKDAVKLLVSQTCACGESAFNAHIRQVGRQTSATHRAGGLDARPGGTGR
jgi:hypothetical protein